MDPFLSSSWTIEDCLYETNADQLRQYIKWMKSHSRFAGQNTSRKSDMIAAIRKQLTVDYCRSIWRNLNTLQQSAVREALYHPKRKLDLVQFTAKYGSLPKITEEKYGTVVTLPFRLFLYSRDRYRQDDLFIPKDLSDVLLQFVPEPPETQLKSINALPAAVQCQTSTYYSLDDNEDISVELTCREMEYAALQDLFSILKLVDQGKISVSAATSFPSAASVRRISEELFQGDYFEPEVKSGHSRQNVRPIKAFAWPLLVLVGNLTTSKNSKLTLTKKGRAVTQSSAAETLSQLWSKWLNNANFDEFNRIDNIKGQFRGRGKRALTSPMFRRDVIEEALYDCPVGEWVHFDDFSKFMRARSYV